MANLLRGFLDNVFKGLFNPKGNLGDYTHASRLYTDNSFRLAPKVKFLYHVVFNIHPLVKAKMPNFKPLHYLELGMLVKNVDLPRFKISLDTVQQYNRKRQYQTRIDYDPVGIVFHDDNLGITSNLWSLYYSYNFADSRPEGLLGPADIANGGNNPLIPGAPKFLKNEAFLLKEFSMKYGMDNDQSYPFFSSIQIFQLSRHQYFSYTLVNPVIESWQHETLDNSSSDPAANKMTVKYEAVIYGQGRVQKDIPTGFATVHYDNSPSPLSLLGGGLGRLFGGGGLLDTGFGLLGDIAGGRAFTDPRTFLGTIIKGANIVNNAKKLTTDGLRQEAFGIVTGAITAGTGVNVNGVASIVFPKSGGEGQTSTITTATPVQQTTTTGPLNRIEVTNFLNSRPGSLDSLSKTVFAKELGLSDLTEVNSRWNSLSLSARAEYQEKTLQKVVNGAPEIQSQYQALLRA